ncbi:MAG: hypothetical protein CMH62_00630, partial [Nanoarchaeota archaeon]|nr:hypothetical protein [Nanoarchaeota archaeon]
MKALFLIKELAFHEPLGLMAMSAFLKQLGVDCKAFITSEEKNLMEKIKKYNPDLILFSATTGIHKFYLELCRQIKKEMKFISIFGGSHPTFYPDFIEEKGVDIVVRGEVEEVLPDFIKNLKSRKSIEKTPGFWVKNKDNKIFRNEIKSYPQDLDKLPFPDRTLLKDYEYLLPKGEKFFISNRGCPYECTYCFNSFNKKLAKGNYVRWRSPQNVIKEIKEVQKSYNIEKINFQDDIFITNKVWLKEFLKLYREEINLPFYCHIRPDLATEEVVKDLKDSNCYCAVFGLESGNDYIRNTVLKRNMSKRDIVNASALLRKYKVNFTTQTMMCLPDETIDMVFETIKLSAKCKPNYINLYFFQ